VTGAVAGAALEVAAGGGEGQIAEAVGEISAADLDLDQHRAVDLAEQERLGVDDDLGAVDADRAGGEAARAAGGDAAALHAGELEAAVAAAVAVEWPIGHARWVIYGEADVDRHGADRRDLDRGDVDEGLAVVDVGGHAGQRRLFDGAGPLAALGQGGGAEAADVREGAVVGGSVGDDAALLAAAIEDRGRGGGVAS